MSDTIETTEAPQYRKEKVKVIINEQGDYTINKIRYNKDGARLYRITKDLYLPAKVIIDAIYDKGFSEYRLGKSTGVDLSIINRVRKGKTLRPRSASMRPIVEVYKNLFKIQ